MPLSFTQGGLEHAGYRRAEEEGAGVEYEVATVGAEESSMERGQPKAEC